MARVNDVAALILKECGSMSAMKLQKLVYYTQAWSLVWDERPAFDERIEAWANGPVAPDLYYMHRGRFMVRPGDIAGDIDEIDQDLQETARAVIKYYGGRSALWLSDLTHSEAPWVDARDGLADGVRGANEITHAAMAEYYSGL